MWKCERLWERYHGVVPSPPYCEIAPDEAPETPLICGTAWHVVGWDKAIKPEDVWSDRSVVVHSLKPTF